LTNRIEKRALTNLDLSRQVYGEKRSLIVIVIGFRNFFRFIRNLFFYPFLNWPRQLQKQVNINVSHCFFSHFI